MPNGKLTLEPRQWYGWLEAPPEEAGWTASPIFVTTVTPLKTGSGRLQIEFLQPMHARVGVQRSAVLQIHQHSSRHLSGAADHDHLTWIICSADFDWFRSYCQGFYERRPPRHPTWIINDEPAEGLSITDYLAMEFGSSETAILHGAGPTSFDVKLHPMPKHSSRLVLNSEYPAFDSWLISRGFVPRQMEDKWFVLLRDDKLFFYRSWTGFLIYEVDVSWRGDSLCLGGARVNRHSKQYTETDDCYDRNLLLYLIDVLLRGIPGDFPQKSGDNAIAPIKAWSTAGIASVQD